MTLNKMIDVLTTSNANNIASRRWIPRSRLIAVHCIEPNSFDGGWWIGKNPPSKISPKFYFN